MDTVNLKQLAKQLNLSVSTVSKAFRNSYDINPATRERILALAKELNYQPNPYASGLRTQKSRTIAVIVPEIHNNFFVQAINGIETVAQEKGYHVLIYLTHEEASKEIDFIQHLQNGRVDAVLLSLSGNKKEKPHLEALQEKGVPVVLFDRVDDEIKAIKVKTNNTECSYIATKHLLDAGCKKIAHLTFSQEMFISQERLRGYQQAIEESGKQVRNNLILNCIPKTDSQVQIEAFLKAERPDGIFSAFEKLALQTYTVCEKLDINIPQDLKLITFSNLDIASMLNPALSVIVQPAFEIGKKAALALFELLDSKKEVPLQVFTLPSAIFKRISLGQ